MKVCRLCRRYAKGGAERCPHDGGDLVEGPVPSAAPGDELGRYRVIRAIGAGQTGVLLSCEAVEPEAGEAVEKVIKVLNPSGQSIDARRAIFESALSLEIEGLHPLEEVFEHEGRLCLVMSPLEGASLAARLPKDGPVSSEEALALGRRLVTVLRVIHESGLAHLDLRPGHLMVADGAPIQDVTLFDLGSPSPPGRLAPPERYEDLPEPEKTDVYGLAITLYVALVGRSPWRADAPGELTWLIRNAPPPPLRVLRQSGPVDPLLERLILWGMAKEARARPSLAQMSEALEAIASGKLQAAEKLLAQAEAAAAAPAEPEARRAQGPAETSSEPTQRRRLLRSSRPVLLEDDHPTMRFVRKFLPRAVLGSTGMTQAFFIEGEEMEREVALAAYEEAIARRENAAAWFRLITLLVVALILGGLTVLALLR